MELAAGCKSTQPPAAEVSTVLRMSSMMSSGWMFSAWPSKLRIRRCRSAGWAHGPQVFAGDVVAMVEDRADLGGQDDGLGSARARAVADEPPGHLACEGVLGVRGQDERDAIPPELVGDRDLAGEPRQLDDPLAVEDRLGAGARRPRSSGRGSSPSPRRSGT